MMPGLTTRVYPIAAPCCGMHFCNRGYYITAFVFCKEENLKKIRANAPRFAKTAIDLSRGAVYNVFVIN